MRLGDYLESERRFAGRLRPEHLYYPASWNSAHAERGVERNRAGRNHVYRQHVPRAKLQDRAFAELLFHLQKGVHDETRALTGFHAGNTSAQLVRVGKRSSQQFNGQGAVRASCVESWVWTNYDHGGLDRWHATRRC